MSEKNKRVIKEWVQSIIIALVLALAIRTFVVQAYKIPTGSMEPTLIPGDRILVNKFLYRFREPTRGEVVVFKAPIERNKDFIKRIVAAGGETLEIGNGNLIIDSKTIKKPEIFNEIYYYSKGDFIARQSPLIIPQDRFFLLGDNSLRSQDSRYWGFVDRGDIKGKAFLIYWPITRIGIIRP